MNDIRRFLKKNLPKHSLNIKYEDLNTYEYKFNHPIMGNREKIIFKENEAEETIELEYNKKTYNDMNEIYLILFDIVDYKNIEYIDNYLQLKLKQKSHVYIEDIYNDYYDDLNRELICIRNLICSNETKKNTKLKFIIYNNKCELYYNHDVINDFDNIIRKIDEIINSL